MTSTIPKHISLHGAPEAGDVETGTTSAILLKLNENILQDVKKASNARDRLQFVTGSTPKLRIGTRNIDLTLSPDDFRNELFASSSGISSTDYTFTSIVNHRAELKSVERKRNDDNTGTDAALVALQKSLASYEQEKQANQTTITNSILPAGKGRIDAGRNEKLARKSPMPGTSGGSRPATPSLGAASTPRFGVAPTSAPVSEDEVKMRAMRTPVVHLLAIGPTRSEEILKKTHIPKDDLDSILQKFGKHHEGRWQLADRAYKELDVWRFQYPGKGDRERAIENAIRAYDRMRLGKDEKLWQMLLPKEERGKGKVLSRLHLGGGVQVNRGLTPQYQPSPTPHVEGPNDSRAPSAANTPRLGASTPRPGSSKGDVMKRLLSKDPKKARAAEDAKDKKRKDREAAASDREGGKQAKKQMTKKTTSNAKSAEFVRSSDENSGDDGEVNERNTPRAKPSPETRKATLKAKPKADSLSSSDSSDAAAPLSKAVEKPAAKAKPPPKAISSPAVKASRPTSAGQSTPQPTNNLSAPNTQPKIQRSPSNSISKPSVPSPLGAARPRVASDVSDKAALGVQKVRSGGAETPNGLGITTNGVRKRQDTVTSTSSAISNSANRRPKEPGASEAKRKTATDGRGTPKAVLVNDIGHKVESGVKRKAEGSPPQDREGLSNTKHRKTESTSSQSLTSHSSTNMASDGTARTSPDGPYDGSSSDSASSVLQSINFNQGVALAEKFRDIYYPAYTKLYDEQAAMEAKGEKVSKEERERLLQMHHRLEQMKREIKAASERVGE